MWLDGNGVSSMYLMIEVLLCNRTKDEPLFLQISNQSAYQIANVQMH